MSTRIVLALLATVGAGLFSSAHTPQVEKRVPAKKALMPDEPGAAASFRNFQRLSEGGVVPENALMRAKAQRDRLVANRPKIAGVNSESWTWKGPGNIGGRIRSILINPSNPSEMYVGSVGGGVWKTTNAGIDWAPLNDFLPALAVGCMTMDPTDSQAFFVGTGESFSVADAGSSNTGFLRGAGIFKTTNGGTTFTQLAATANSDFYFVNRIAISQDNHNVVLAATNTGIFRSSNGGESWVQTFAGKTYDLDFDPNNAAKVIAGLSDGTSLWSEDSGQTWTASSGLAGTRIEMSYAKSVANVVFASVTNAGRIKVYRSADGGHTFVRRTTGNGAQTYEDYNNALWVSPVESNTLIVGGVSLFKSGDGGIGLGQAFNGVHSDMHVIVSHPGFDGINNKTVFVGCDGGIYRIDNVSVNPVVNLNNNLGITQFYGASMTDRSEKIIAGAQDNGTEMFFTSTNWTQIFGGDGGFTAADPTDGNYFYGEVQRAYIFRTTNGGVSADYIFQGPNPIAAAGTLDVNFIPFYMLDPNEANRMYVCGRLLWRSNNVKAGQPDWFSIKTTIDPGGHPNIPNDHFENNSPYNISTMAVAEGNANLIYLGYNNGEVWKSVNASSANPTWTRVDTGDLPNRYIGSIAIDKTNFNNVYVSFMGWEANNVWKTSNGGTSWVSVSGTGGSALPMAPVSAIAVNKVHPTWLYAGTDIGVFTSEDSGANWTTSTDGPGTVAVEQLVWRNDRELLAVTHGRGVFLADTTAGLTNLIIVPSVVIGGVGSAGQVAIQPVAPFATSVRLSSNRPEVIVPATATVFQGQTLGGFGIATRPVSSKVDATVTARLGPTMRTADITILPSSPATLTISPSSILGGTSTTGTLTMNGQNGPDSRLVELSSSAAVASVPESVALPANATSVSFTVNTTPVSVDANATITATMTEGTVTAVVTVKAPQLKSITVSPTSVVSGYLSTGTVTLFTPAPPNGIIVSLSDNSPSVSVPAAVKIFSTKTTQVFNVTTQAVATDADATISASANGVTRTANLHLYASGLTLITLNPPSVGGGASSTGTVYLAYAAPPGGKVVTLSDDSPYSTTPPSVTVLQGKTTASFVVTTVSVSDPQVARITGVLDGVNRFSDLSIVPAQLVRVSVNPTSVAGGLSASGSVALNGPAPEGGATVQLSSSNPIAAQVPEAVTILQGNFAKVFNVTTTIVGEETNVTITATRGSVTKTTNLLVQGIQLLAFTISPSTVVGGVQSSGTVTIAHPAPSGGLVVSFFNENPAASLYATVRIPAGATTASFPIFTRVVTTRTIVTITATRGNSKTATITLLPVP